MRTTRLKKHPVAAAARFNGVGQGRKALAFYFLEINMHPYERLRHLLAEFANLDEALDNHGMFRCALEMREAASDLVIEVAQNMGPMNLEKVNGS